jgi:uncharacterized protein (DUF488 family)
MWTIGHSTRSLEELAGLLRAHTVAKVVDVRAVPSSRRHPHFDRESLSTSLGELGLGYGHLPGLGGRRRPRPDSINTAWQNASFRGYADYMQTTEFARNLEALLAEAAATRVAIMCAEAVPWRCHRSLLADALLARGVAVEHILGRGPARPHTLTPWARVAGGHVTYPSLLAASGGA